MSEDILVKKHSLDSDEEDEAQEIKERYFIAELTVYFTNFKIINVLYSYSI